jgi:hypothetical protein
MGGTAAFTGGRKSIKIAIPKREEKLSSGRPGRIWEYDVQTSFK